MPIVVQLVGSLLVLAAFALAQWGVLDGKSVRYLVLNIVGSAALAVDAAIGAQWGFLLLEGVWAIVSAISLVGVLRTRRTASETAGSSAVHPQPTAANAGTGE